MQIVLNSGDYEIISSGQIFLFEETGNLKIEMDDKNKFKLSVILNFLYSESKIREIKKEIKNNTMVLNCFNFKENSAGLTKPVHIANIDGKKVYIMFWSYLEGNCTPRVRSVKYTFFCK